MCAQKAYDVVGIGVAAVDDMLYVEDYPRRNVKTPLAGTERHGGGPACTATAAVGTLYGRCAYVARFGDNSLAAYIESVLKSRGVDTAHIVYDSQAAPYHSYIVADRSGNRNVFFDASGFRPVTAEDVPESLILSAKIILLDHVAEPALIAVAEKIRKLRVPILGDIEGCSESALRLAELTDYLVVPEEFACWAANSSDPEEACAHLARTKRLATVVTSGAEGCYLCEAGSTHIEHFPAFEVEAFDTNGCGDTFHGAFALALARGLELREIITFASAAAALKANARDGKQRGWDALPVMDEIIALLKDQPHVTGARQLLKSVGRLQASGSQISQSL